MHKAVVLWTGGKDCNLALYQAKVMGYEIVSLITFAMENARFRAHSIKIIEAQSIALGIPHTIIHLQEPYKEAYEEAIIGIRDQYQIDTIVTGDIAEVHGNTNWITERSKPAGVNVLIPLWHAERQQVLHQLFSAGFKVIFSCVKEPWFGPGWLGRELNRDIVTELNKIHELTDLDICGEQGEYHTLVLDGPLYKKEITIDSFTPQKEEVIRFMDIIGISLQEKQST
ncbi:uncharacterized protein (TIGR00290 family) [Chitinophaga polysaccharea]|uniref:Uncharacterized protein (TIGR00290 family) n=1 Tax=Chitinophaga polysaccharea TaxID=1293035 RepID=A0A561PB96_9BACT|nr:diphthine--ammonia ligase [Chitinophaga polysaccharea]TWF35306.1 uncharacterized protein (TIGR00290 family) [Chitinophaga polysaccharea]